MGNSKKVITTKARRIKEAMAPANNVRSVKLTDQQIETIESISKRNNVPFGSVLRLCIGHGLKRVTGKSINPLVS